MQLRRSCIRQCVPANNAVDILVGQRFKQSGIEFPADSLAHRFRAAVNRGLHGGVIGCFRPETHGAGIAHHHAVFFRHHQPMSSGQSKLLEPCCAPLHRVRLNVECDRSMDNVVVVDLRQARQDRHGSPDGFGWSSNETSVRTLPERKNSCRDGPRCTRGCGNHRQASSANQSCITAEHRPGNDGAADKRPSALPS